MNINRRTENTQLPTEEQVVDWLKNDPRTYNWDAMIFYDRFQTNQMILQEYIDRYSKDQSYFEPISGEIIIEDGRHWEHLYDAVLDAPRLSFEKSKLADSKATLTLHLMGGSHLTVKKPPNQPKEVTMIETYVPQQAPKVIGGVLLNEADTTVSDDNRVLLNLKNGLDIKMTIGTTDSVQKKAGEMFQAIFDGWPEEKQIFVLNTLDKFEDGEYLEPEKFRMRVLPAPGADRRNSGSYGDGAVMVLVAGKGSPVGQLPDADSEWVYPIPQGRSSTLLLANRLLMSKIVAMGLKNSPFTYLEDFSFSESGETGIELIKVTGGHTVYGSLTPHPDLGEVDVRSMLGLSVDYDSTGFSKFEVKSEGERVVFSWEGDSRYRYGAVVATHEADPFDANTVGYDMLHNNRRTCSFQLGEDGSVHLVPIGENIHNVSLNVVYFDTKYEEKLELVNAVALSEMRKYMSAYFDSFIDATREIDLFRLHGLLFRSDHAVHVQSARLPCDLALFGDISPNSMRFGLVPLEQVVLAGSTTEMKIEPVITGVTWSVDLVQGHSGDAGSIDAKGNYTAPAVSTFPGEYTTVRISATEGSHTSSGLVRVVAKGMAINPVVALTSLNGGVTKVSGGSVDGSALSWRLKTSTGAKLTAIPPAGGAEFEVGDHFYEAGDEPSGSGHSVDEITVTNAKGESTTSYIVVAEKMVNSMIVIDKDAGLPEGQLQLVLDAGLGAIPNATWTVVAGGGTIDANGVLTINEDSPHKFTVITASFVMVPVADYHACLILPVPLIDLGAYLRAVS